MRSPYDEQTIEDAKSLYLKIQHILKIRGMKWKELADLIGINSRTLSSMKSQNQVPSVFTVKKIAEALDVSMDELFDSDTRTQELYDLYWELPRIMENSDNLRLSCIQIRYLAYAIANKDIVRAESRETVCKDEARSKLDSLDK